MRAMCWWVLFLSLALAVGAAPQSRAILLIWDSANDQSVETHLKLVQQLKVLRGAGHFSKVAGLDPKIKVYDCAQAAHMAVVKHLGRQRSQAPYLALVRLDKQGVPAAVEWGEQVRVVESALSDLDGQLGLGQARGGPPDGGWPATSSGEKQAPPTALAQPHDVVQRFFQSVSDRDFKTSWSCTTRATQDAFVQAVAEETTMSPERVRNLFSTADPSLARGFWESFRESSQSPTIAQSATYETSRSDRGQAQVIIRVGGKSIPIIVKNEGGWKFGYKESFMP